MSNEPSHADLLAEIRVQGVKLDGIAVDLGEVKTTLKSNTSRLASVEKWIESHDAIVRFVKWTLAVLVAVAGPLIAIYALLKDR